MGQYAKGQGIRATLASFRFAIIGHLLANPPDHGQLQVELKDLSRKRFRHPITLEVVHYSSSTLERWFYLARNQPQDPVGALRRKLNPNLGKRWSVSASLALAIRQQYQDHPSWSYKLHYDNLLALARQDEQLTAVPAYPTVRRFMKEQGMLKQPKRRRGKRRDEGVEAEELVFQPRERRSFESSHVSALWHLDFHEGKRKVLTKEGRYITPMLLGVLDDRSRLCCHLQWYTNVQTESLVHGLCQALMKRGLCRALLTDNGSAMVADETTQGLERLGITHHTTLPRTPEQNAKQEVFWAQVEGRLMAMLEGEKELTLKGLNDATQAWVELEYHRKPHRELDMAPLDCFLQEPNVIRDCPSYQHLRQVFRKQEQRTQRLSDGTISVYGVRFELPQCYRSLKRPTIRVARWDLSSIDLIDPHTDKVLCPLFPLDKQSNADGRRRAIDLSQAPSPPRYSGIAPHLKQLMAEHAATGAPPVYLPYEEGGVEEQDEVDEMRQRLSGVIPAEEVET